MGSGAVGGAEVILSQIEAALPQLGFRSVVVAHAASQPQGRLYPTLVPEGTITDTVRASVEAAQQCAIDHALAENSVALVHMHGLDFERYRIPDGIPVLVTLHLPPSWYPASLWSASPKYHFVCVSETQRQSCPEHMRERIVVIGNGVPLPERSTLRPARHYALLLSRICAEKNIHTALDAARFAGMPALVAGEVFPYEAHQRYFAEMVEPRLTRMGQEHTAREPHEPAAEARFLGPVTGAAKARLLSRASCLLLPSLAPETSSLVAMEALAAGVPVIAMASGAVSEAIEDGHTGFLISPEPGTGVQAAQAMADAIGRLPSLDRQACRSVAEARFPLDRMLQAYAELYRHRALKADIVPAEPGTRNTSTTRHRDAAIAIEDDLYAEELATELALESILPAWTALWAEDPHATPFQHPAWLWPWWRQFGPDGTLCAYAVRSVRTGRLLGLLPTYLYRQPDTGERQLLLLGAGTSDYLDGLWSPAAPDAVAAALKPLMAPQSAWDSVTLHQLRAESPLLQMTQQLGIEPAAAEPCFLLRTAAPLPPKLRANVGRYRRRAQATGALACTVAATATEARSSFDSLVSLHGQRWEARGEAGVLSDPRVLAHHREALPGLLQAGLLRLFRLTLGEELLGVLYAFADPPQRPSRSLYLYLIGIDPRFADLSPGTLLLHEVWRYAQREGFASLNLLRGGEDYKQLWGAEPNPTYSLHWKAKADQSSKGAPQELSS